MSLTLESRAYQTHLSFLQASDGPWWLRTGPIVGGELGPRLFLRVYTLTTGVTTEVLYRPSSEVLSNEQASEFMWKVGAEHQLQAVLDDDAKAPYWVPQGYVKVGTRTLEFPEALPPGPSYEFFRLFGLTNGSSQRAVSSEIVSTKYTRVLDPVTQNVSLTVVPMIFTPNTSLPVWRKETWTPAPATGTSAG